MDDMKKILIMLRELSGVQTEILGAQIGMRQLSNRELQLLYVRASTVLKDCALTLEDM